MEKLDAGQLRNQRVTPGPTLSDVDVPLKIRF